MKPSADSMLRESVLSAGIPLVLAWRLARKRYRKVCPCSDLQAGGGRRARSDGRMPQDQAAFMECDTITARLQILWLELPSGSELPRVDTMQT